MNKTKIEWTDFTCNNFWGCQNGCSYCVSRSFAWRFAEHHGRIRGYDTETIRKMKNFEPVYLPDQLAKIKDIKKPQRIFMSMMGDPFCDAFHNVLPDVFDTIRKYPQHTFQMLTKCPENLLEYSPFPDNCWIGCSCTDQKAFTVAADYLAMIDAPVKFISFEPLLNQIDLVGKAWQEFMLSGINWVIVGQQTPVRKSTAPKLEWVREIVEAADDAAIPVFLKDNLKSLIPPDSLGEGLRQEFPDSKKRAEV